eukprot:1393409-Amorphochlora_amoeboformis.AAC.1
MRRSQQYIPREVYTKVFLNKESKNLLAPAMEPLRIPAASPVPGVGYGSARGEEEGRMRAGIF